MANRRQRNAPEPKIKAAFSHANELITDFCTEKALTEPKKLQ